MMHMPKRSSVAAKYLFTALFGMSLIVSVGESSVGADSFKGERIIYSISPLGRAEYNDLGEVDVEGRAWNKVTFKTDAMGFHDTETIYSDGQSRLPIKVERDIVRWGRREYIVEHYDQKNFVLTIDKYKGKKKVKQYVFKKDDVIHNAILLPFYLRGVHDLDIGWEIKVRIPDEFTIRLGSIEEIRIPSGKFMAYHFTSMPSKFEIWISKDDLRLPLKIKGLGMIDYTMIMRKHYKSQEQVSGSP